ncbi:MAG TPA: hypothetical protein VEP29_01350 [Desulfatiglandales bacterium]|nr:hypothetical protein [Desulfatiglandales bacterium]
MSTTYGANYADTVDEAFVRKTCPKELAAFEKAKEDVDIFPGESMAFDDALDNHSDVLEEAQYRACKEAYGKLLSEFKKKTGLTLMLATHDSENNGCKGDEISGEFWSVDGVWQLTKAGKKYKRQITRQYFVTFG